MSDAVEQIRGELASLEQAMLADRSFHSDVIFRIYRLLHSLPSSDNRERVEELEERVKQLVDSRDRAWAALYRKDHHIITMEDGDRYCAWCDNETCREEHYAEVAERMRPVVEAAQKWEASTTPRWNDYVRAVPEFKLRDAVRVYENTVTDNNGTDSASESHSPERTGPVDPAVEP
jgi:hypothetical protein